MSFEGKIALVTGGSRGVGKAISLEFARRGVDVVFNYFRDHDAASEMENHLVSLGVRSLKIKAHLGEVDKIQALFDQIENEFGRLDILVNNAASGVHRTVSELTTKHWEWTMNVNARAPWLCAMNAARLMDNGGKIINITSQGSRKVLPYYFSVGTSKAALEAVTRYLAVELAPKGISVNAVSGGYMETEALQSFPNSKEMIQASQSTLAGRVLHPEDIAKVVAFLCEEDANMIRGQVLVVDGGFSLTV